ncbi:septal ring lytic transglycosylase RlpA family protein [Taklimakanibacter deserti]|uniref:septal ring lytic transglycosylase RlpA family protein n=1 Tax=Taklimakanibacter deserti TaxID=2267839 RepID=UPI000E65BA6E
MKRILAALSMCAFLLPFILHSSAPAGAQTGMASYYKSGRLTANGEKFNPNGFTAAHRFLKFGTLVRVTNLKTGRSIVVRINDRGPFIRGRIIDLAYGAAKAVGLHNSGVAKVQVAVLN